MEDVAMLVAAIARLGDGAAGLAAVETRLGPGHRAPRHVHPEPEAFAVLEGALELELPSGTVRLAAGESTVAPADVPHAYRAGAAGARIVTATRTRCVARYENFVRAVAPAGVEPSADELATLGALAAGTGIALDSTL